VPTDGDYVEVVVVKTVDETVCVREATGPEPSEAVFERLGLAGPCRRIAPLHLPELAAEDPV